MREERRGGKRENFKKVIVHISSRFSVSYHSPVSWLKGFKGKTKTIATDNTTGYQLPLYIHIHIRTLYTYVVRYCRRYTKYVSGGLEHATVETRGQ